jgi:hypothetical protein
MESVSRDFITAGWKIKETPNKKRCAAVELKPSPTTQKDPTNDTGPDAPVRRKHKRPPFIGWRLSLMSRATSSHSQ